MTNIPNYRNARYLENGWIDCEIQHEKFGWIPFTCNPHDTGTTFNAQELFQKMVTHGVEPYVKPNN